jgi:UPF0755 protein
MSLRGGGKPRQYTTNHARPRTRERYSGGGGRGSVVRFLVLVLVLAALVLFAMLTVLRPLATSFIASWAIDNPGALTVPFVSDIVHEELGEELTAPASSDPSEVEWVVRPGDTVASLAPRLVNEGLVVTERAFIVAAAEGDLAADLQAGTFLLRRDMTPAELVRGLVDNRIVDRPVPVLFREGLRIEQMAAKLQTVDTTVDPAEFYAIASEPPAELLADYPWLELPEGATLEGYLYPATYDIGRKTTAEVLVRQMLDAFYERVGQERIDAILERGLTLHEVVTLASIVEKEAKLDEERALIAGVYQNRIDKKMLLNADPTVIWGVDTMALADLDFDEWQSYFFWSPPGVPLASIDFPEEIAGYQTYQVRGLIPGPIVSPTAASIDAAVNPDTEDGYLYFVAIPDGDGAHDFSKTLREHERKLREYGYTG